MSLKENFKHLYFPPNDSAWKSHPKNLEGLRIHEVVRFLDLKKNLPPIDDVHAYGLIGFHCDKDSKDVSNNIRRSLAGMPWRSLDHVLYDAGDIKCIESTADEAQECLVDVFNMIFQLGLKPIILGGNEQTAINNWKSIALALPDQECAFVKFTPHLNFHPYLEENKVSLDKAKSITFFGIQPFNTTETMLQVANDSNLGYVYADEFHIGGIEHSLDYLEEIMTKSQKIYVSLSMDVFAAPFVSDISNPQPLGLLPWHVIPGLSLLAESGKVVCFDFTELEISNIQGGSSAQLAASILARMLV